MTKPATVNGISVKVLAGIEETQRRSQEVCARKRRYSDECAARGAGCETMHRDRPPQQVYIYKCRWCLGWRLTRQEQARHWAADYYTKDMTK